jgi:hypothetical protein
LLGIARGGGHETPTVAPTIERVATVGEIDAESWQTAGSREPVFTSMDVILYGLSL